jgi:P4 family phage/plasmid primase-like protien
MSYYQADLSKGDDLIDPLRKVMGLGPRSGADSSGGNMPGGGDSPRDITQKPPGWTDAWQYTSGEAKSNGHARGTSAQTRVIYPIPEAMKGNPTFVKIAGMLQDQLDSMPPDRAIAFLESNRFLLDYPDLAGSSDGNGANEEKEHGAPARWRPWNERSEELAVWVGKSLVVRRDRYGRYVVRRNGTIGQDTAWNLTDAHILRHFRAKDTKDVIGLHTTVWIPVSGAPRGGVSACRLMCIDIDHHGDGPAPEGNLRAALAWYAILVGLGFRPLLIDSNGRGGYRLYVIFDQEITARHSRQLGRWLTRDYAAYGLAECPEIFPKQDEITAPDGPRPCGNWLRIPGRRHGQDHWSRVWDGDEFAEGDDAIDIILDRAGDSPQLIPAECLAFDPEPRAVGDDRARVRTDEELQGDAALAKEALGWLKPGVKDRGGREYLSDYDHWLRIGMALHELGDIGLALWLEWSRQCGEKFDEEVCVYKWGTFRDDGEKRVRLATLFKFATRAGRPGPWLVDETDDGEKDTDGAEKDTIDAGLARRPKTDTGNAERMVARFGGRFRYCHAWKKYLCNDGRRWVLDDLPSVQNLAKRTARKILAEASTVEDKTRRGYLVKWARQSESRSRLNAMIALTIAEAGVSILPDGFDSHPWLLNVENGTIDLQTGELRPHRREDLITQMAPVAFDPSAKCPLWDSVLLRVFNNDEELVSFWDRLSGLALTGVTHEQILPILWGSGSNGKSTIVKTLVNLLGPDFAMIAPPGLLIKKHTESHPTERATLYGKRLIVEMETEEGVRLNENLVKHLTGGDPITCRRMNENFWSFNPTHKLMLCTNHKPEVKGTDHAIWRRPKLVPFVVTIPDSEAITDLADRLRAELPGILARCVRGCLEWQRDGLGVPSKVTEATAGYRAEQDILAEFIKEECVVSVQLFAKATPLYDRYRQWAGTDALNQRAFGKAMSERGYERYSNNGTCYRGIGLCAPAAADSDDGD